MILGWIVALWTQDDIDRLKVAISSGVLTVRYAGPPAREMTYQSLKEMRALLAEMIGDVATQEGSPPPTYRRVKVSKGFRDAKGE